MFRTSKKWPWHLKKCFIIFLICDIFKKYLYNVKNVRVVKKKRTIKKFNLYLNFLTYIQKSSKHVFENKSSSISKMFNMCQKNISPVYEKYTMCIEKSRHVMKK